MAERFELSIADAPPRSVYPWLTASLIPRAIAWISTVDADGVENLAPHSFTTVAGVDPPTLCFTSVGHKDTLANARATGEFVLSIATDSMLAAMNDSATPFPAELSEFDAAGIEREASVLVTPPRVAAAPISFECRVTGEHAIGKCVMVFGEVVHLSAHTDVLAPDGMPDPELVRPLARMGRNEWTTLGRVIALDRIKYEDWQQGSRSDC